MLIQSSIHHVALLIAIRLILIANTVDWREFPCPILLRLSQSFKTHAPTSYQHIEPTLKGEKDTRHDQEEEKKARFMPSRSNDSHLDDIRTTHHIHTPIKV